MKYIYQMLFVCLILPAGVLGNQLQQPKVIVEKGDIAEIRFKPFAYLNIENQDIFKKVFRVLWTDKNGFLASIRERDEADFIIAFIAKTKSPPVEEGIAFDSITANAAGRMIVYYPNKPNGIKIVWMDREGQSADKAMQSFLDALAQDRAENAQGSAGSSEGVEAGKKNCPDGKKTRPVITQRVKASYNPEARKEGIHGIVVIGAVFAVDGRLSDYRVIKGLPYGLTAMALKAALVVRFQPATCNGKPIPERGTLEYSFALY